MYKLLRCEKSVKKQKIFPINYKKRKFACRRGLHNTKWEQKSKKVQLKFIVLLQHVKKVHTKKGKTLFKTPGF